MGRGWTPPRLSHSVETHTCKEWHSGEIVATVVDSYKPLVGFLKHTLTTTTMSFQNSIQAGFGRLSLPTTIEQFQPGFTDSGNQVTVQENIGNVAARNHLSIVTLPVTTITDGSVHQAFDLTHGVNPSTTNVVWHGMGGSTRGLVPVLRLSHSLAVPQ